MDENSLYTDLNKLIKFKDDNENLKQHLIDIKIIKKSPRGIYHLIGEKARSDSKKLCKFLLNERYFINIDEINSIIDIIVKHNGNLMNIKCNRKYFRDNLLKFQYINLDRSIDIINRKIKNI